MRFRDMKFGFVLFDDLEELDFIGPWEILRIWSQYADGPETCPLISESGGTVRCAKGLTIVTDMSFADCPQLDCFLVPGGLGTRRKVNNPAIVDFVRTQAAAAKNVLSVCTGSFILAAAGLLEGRRATTHWGSLNRLRNLPGVTVVEERFVRDEKIWTAAGVSAGIDLMLAVISDLAGEETAGICQSFAEYYPSHHRYGNFDSSDKAPGYLRDSSNDA